MNSHINIEEYYIELCMNTFIFSLIVNIFKISHNLIFIYYYEYLSS